MPKAGGSDGHIEEVSKEGGFTTAQFALVRLTDNKARKSRLILLPVKNYKNMKLFEIKSHHQVM